ncbi:MAG TPA: translation initiation factor IF-6 [Nitrososphaera sp.]|jgi:translation initiation factor 6|nr:translation initiation factor IF-6 [Nitrososphaera sp.]
MAIYRYTAYKTPNIGIFAKANDSTLLVPFGFAETKTQKLAEYLQAKEVYTSVGGTRLLGPMTVMNNNGILLPSIASDEEVQLLRQASGLNVEKVESRFTAIGNLISTNDNGAIASPLFDGEVDQQIQDVLGVPVHSMTIGSFVQTGSMIVATNGGAGVHPKASEEEVKTISEVLQVPAEPVTVNGGVPFLSSGIISNTKAVVVGSLTSGPELIMLSRIFKA